MLSPIANLCHLYECLGSWRLIQKWTSQRPSSQDDISVHALHIATLTDVSLVFVIIYNVCVYVSLSLNLKYTVTMLNVICDFWNLCSIALIQVLGVYLLTDSVQVAQKARGSREFWGDVLGQGQLAISPPAREMWERCKLALDGAPVAQWFFCTLKSPAYAATLLRVNSRRSPSVWQQGWLCQPPGRPGRPEITWARGLSIPWPVPVPIPLPSPASACTLAYCCDC